MPLEARLSDKSLLDPRFRQILELALVDVCNLSVPSMSGFKFEIYETYRTPERHAAMYRSGLEKCKYNFLGDRCAVKLKLYNRTEHRWSDNEEDRGMVWAYNMLISLLRGKYGFLSGKDLRDEDTGKRLYDHGLFYVARSQE